MSRLLLFITASLLFGTCAKDKAAQPSPAAFSSFSCMVNGETWVAETPASVNGPIPVNVEYHSGMDALSISAVQVTASQAKYEKIYLSIRNLHQDPFISPGQGELTGWIDFVNNYSCSQYFYDTANPGFLDVILHDTANRVFEATFSMTLRNPDCAPDSLLNITNGKMKINY